jgi:hypothetical protein
MFFIEITPENTLLKTGMNGVSGKGRKKTQMLKRA